jgi:hypothetical protein
MELEGNIQLFVHLHQRAHTVPARYLMSVVGRGYCGQGAEGGVVVWVRWILSLRCAGVARAVGGRMGVFSSVLTDAWRPQVFPPRQRRRTSIQQLLHNALDGCVVSFSIPSFLRCYAYYLLVSSWMFECRRASVIRIIFTVRDFD